MTTIDERILRVSLNIDGQLKTFSSPLYISSTGKNCTNPLESEVEVRLGNVSKADADYLLTACSPFNKDKSPKVLILEAGRISTGTNIIFQGNISTCTPTQPPDMLLCFKCQAHQYVKGSIVASQQGPSVPLSQIVAQVAADCGLACDFQATDKNISNYAFTGAALKQVEKLANAGGVHAFVHGNTLYVTNLNTPLRGALRVLDADSGMVGIPELTEQGVKVKYLLDNQSKVGGALQIQSVVWPALNGTYQIFALGWDVASREDPFYWVADCKRLNDGGAVVIPAGIKKKKRK